MDTFYKGASSAVGFAVESVWGTKGTVFRKFGIPTGTTDPNKTATVVNLLDMNESREGTAQTVTAEKYEIKHSFYVNDYYGLKSILSKVVKAGSGAPFKYTFTPDCDVPAFSFYHKINNCDPSKNISDIYVGCKIKTANFTINEGLLMCDLTFSAKERLKDQGEIVITENNADPYKYADVINGELSIDSKNIQIDEWSFSIDNKMVERQAGLTISEQSVTDIAYSQTAKGQMNSTDLRDLVGGAEVDMAILFSRGTNDTLSFKSKVMITSAPNPTSKSEVVSVSIAPSTRTLAIEYVTATDINLATIVL